MRYRVGEMVWYWPEGWDNTVPPLAAVITGETQTDEYGLHVFVPPGVYPEMERVWARDADAGEVKKGVARFRARTDDLETIRG